MIAMNGFYVQLYGAQFDGEGLTQFVSTKRPTKFAGDWDGASDLFEELT
jgi:hypothetical protein